MLLPESKYLHVSCETVYIPGLKSCRLCGFAGELLGLDGPTISINMFINSCYYFVSAVVAT